MEKICQIATVGENIEWIIKGILLFKAHKLTLISTSESKFLDKIKEIKKRLLDPQFETNPIEIEEKIVDKQDALTFVKALKEIVFKNYEQGYIIEINATAGLTAWQLLAYFTSIQLKKQVRNFFIIDKQKGEAFDLPPGVLSKTEQLILDIIDIESKNIEEIKELYKKNKGKNVSNALISKYLTKLREKNLISEFKSEKLKFFELTYLGHLYQTNLNTQFKK